MNIPDEAVAAAQSHYEAINTGNEGAWAATLSKDNAQTVKVSGGTAANWWNEGRRYVEAYGVQYGFDRAQPETHKDQQGEIVETGRVKAFFKRMQPDGSVRGMPVPVTLAVEDGRWVVIQGSY